jgi:tetratricopeptide (TPR) repeat protein
MARKRLNRKLIIGLTLLVFAGIVLLSVVMLNQLRQRDPQFFADLAEQARAGGEWEQAAILYKKAWERGRNAGYLVELGEVLLASGDVQNAMAAWSQALVTNPNLAEAHRRRVDLLLERCRLSGRVRDWEQLEDAADDMLAIDAELTDADRAFVRFAKGVALTNSAELADSRLADGLAELEAAVDLAPDEVDYPLELASLYFREKMVEKGESTMQRLLAEYDEPSASASKVRWTYAQHLASEQKFDEAEGHFEAGLALAPEGEARREAKLAYAGFLSHRWARAVRQGGALERADELFHRAETTLRECVDGAPDSYRPYLQLASLYNAAARNDDVLEVCKERLDLGLERKGVHAPRDRMDTFSLQILASDACVAKAVQGSERGYDAERDKWLDEAQQYARQAEGESPNHPRVLSQLGRIKVARGELRAAIPDLRAAHEGYKSFGTMNWDNLVTLARLHVQLNEPGAARELMESVLDQARRQRLTNPVFWLLYGRTLVQTNELDRALAIADRVLLADPDHGDAKRLKAAVMERQGKSAEAGRLFEESTGDHAAAVILAAREASLEGDSEAAVELLKTALVGEGSEPRLVAALANELVNAGRRDEARQAVSEALALSPEDSGLKRMSLFFREDLSERERQAAMLALIESEPDAYKRSLDRVSYLVSQEDSQGTLAAIDDALAHVVAKDTPLARNAGLAQHRALLRAKVRMAAGVDDTAALAAARDAAVRHNVDGVGGKTIIGLYHMARKEYEPAITAFRQALEAQPTDAWTLTQLGQVLQLLGRHDEARESYERALEINPDDALAHKGLAWLAKLEDRPGDFEAHLDVCARVMPSDPWVQQELLARQERTDPAAAIARREALLAEDPDDLANLQQLAGLCELTGQQAQADAHYLRLLELGPDRRQVTAQVAGYFRRTNRPERALALLRDLAAKMPTSRERADAKILVAAHLLEVGGKDEAEATLLAAAAESETLSVTRSLAEFYWREAQRPEEALSWLNKAVELARSSDPSLLPRLLEARVAYQLDPRVSDRAGARRDVDELLAKFPNQSRAHLFSSELFASEGRIDRAATALSEHLARHPNDAGALYRRARHYVTLGRLGPAVEDLEAVRRLGSAELGATPRLLLAELYQRTDRKERWIQELESLVADLPASAEAVERLAGAYLREGRAVDADRLVTGRINRAGGVPDPRWFFLRGEVSFELGDAAKAVSDFQRGAQLSNHSVASVLRVLSALTRAGRVGDAVAMCRERGAFGGSQPLLASRCAAMLALSGETDDAVTHFHAAMAQLLDGSPEAATAVEPDLLTAFADPVALDGAIRRFEALAVDGTGRRAKERILVRLYQTAGRLDDAASLLEGLVQSATVDGERAALFQRQGDVHQLAGRPEEARSAYEQALNYAPNNWVILNNLAYLLANSLDEYEEAVVFARRAVAISDDASALDTLGWAYVGLGQYDSAIAELSRAVRLDPDDALAQFHLGEAYRRRGQMAEARGVLQGARGLAQSQGDAALVKMIDEAVARLGATERSP